MKVRLGKGMAKPIDFVSPEAEEKKSKRERKKTEKEELSIRQYINFLPFHEYERITLK